MVYFHDLIKRFCRRGFGSAGRRPRLGNPRFVATDSGEMQNNLVHSHIFTFPLSHIKNNIEQGTRNNELRSKDKCKITCPIPTFSNHHISTFSHSLIFKLSNYQIIKFPLLSPRYLSLMIRLMGWPLTLLSTQEMISR